jgi:hypothetical protein
MPNREIKIFNEIQYNKRQIILVKWLNIRSELIPALKLYKLYRNNLTVWDLVVRPINLFFMRGDS